MLVIADAANPVAVAGIMGGASSEVTEQTTTVLLESAYFDPGSIRRTSKALGLSTEASYRFERGADYEMLIVALDRAASLMAELAGGAVARGLIDEYPRPFAPQEVSLRYRRLERILGIEVPPKTAVSILDSLGFRIVSEESESVRVVVPSYRPDISAEIDLIEEVARIFGYNRIEATYPQDTTVMTRGAQQRSLEDDGKLLLKGCGFSEVINLSLGAPSAMADFPESYRGRTPEPIPLKNPLTEDASVLRTTLLPGLLRCLRDNINAGARDLKIFEIGRVYWPAEGEVLPEEPNFVCAAATGQSKPMHWKGGTDDVDFFEMKGVIETFLESLGATEPGVVRASWRGFHPGACADIVVAGKSIGRLGEIHPSLLEKYEIDQNVYVFEMSLTDLESFPATERLYRKISRFPCADRDLAIVVDEHTEADALKTVITKAGGPLLKNARLFDIYRGAQVGEGRKSLAFSLRFQSDERTLTDEEVQAACDNILKALEEEFEAQLRA
jgi:phenylalanyl-tRNA synthetase beta chain